MAEDGNWYQNRPEAHTALLFARIREGHQPDFVIPHFGQEAYENYQLAVYMRQLLRVHHDENFLCWSPGFPYLYAAIRTLLETQQTVRISEVGSTLFATIDKIRKCERTLGPFPVGSRLEFCGIEISNFFNDVAARLHPGESIDFHADYTEVPSTPYPTIGRCYQASSYAFQSTDQLIDWTARSSFSIQGAWFTVGGGESTVDAIGKRSTFFDYRRFVSGLRERGHRVHHIQSDRYVLQGTEFLSTWFLTQNFDDSTFERFCRLCLSDPRMNPQGVVTGFREARRATIPEVPFKGQHAGGIDPDEPRLDLRHPLSFDFGSAGLEAKFVEHIARIDSAG